MPTTISGTDGVSAVVNGTIVADDIAADAVTTAKILNANVTPAKLSQPLTFDTAKASTGTSIEFTGIPSWARRITILLNGVSTNGGSRVIVQIGSGSFVTSGYLGSACDSVTTIGNTTGFNIDPWGIAADTRFGAYTLHLIGSNNWIFAGTSGLSNTPQAATAGGSVALSGALDRVRVTTANGTDTFDAGSINIAYEG